MASSDRIAIVTGTSSGIGRALADILLRGGWAVIGVARRVPDLTHPAYRHLTLDLTDLAATTAAFERDIAPMLHDRAVERVGLVNNAAVIGRAATIETTVAESLLATYAVNVVAPTWLVGFVLRHARRDCAVRIVNVSSGAAMHASPGMGEYSGTKAALRMMSMAAAADLASEPLAGRGPSDVAVLSYAPGTVDTAMQAAARAQPAETFPSAAMFHGFHDQGKLVPPAAPAAEIAAFLNSAHPPRFAERRLGDA
ncbi:MAG: SDR family NAD(P)-dependent oxidoreductase [Gemmatimonadaceae bacterium]